MDAEFSRVFMIFLAAIAAQVIGMIWYSQKLFGKLWITEMGLSKKEIKNMEKHMDYTPFIISFLGALVTAYVISHIMIIFEITTIASALILALFLGIGFVIMPQLTNYVFEKRSMTLYSINNLYILVYLIVMAVMLV